MDDKPKSTGGAAIDLRRSGQCAASEGSAAKDKSAVDPKVGGKIEILLSMREKRKASKSTSSTPQMSTKAADRGGGSAISRVGRRRNYAGSLPIGPGLAPASCH
jgi:hypothetical protein